ncbi:MAG: hypothetical protein CSA35_01845 [Dethiosulfovibrio peptidovorans]|nr:MAG: hypothetical protein CSA35_01845 [Dethiosulfovibrio peptidovorans]
MYARVADEVQSASAVVIAVAPLGEGEQWKGQARWVLLVEVAKDEDGPLQRLHKDVEPLNLGLTLGVVVSLGEFFVFLASGTRALEVDVDQGEAAPVLEVSVVQSLRE